MRTKGIGSIVAVKQKKVLAQSLLTGFTGIIFPVIILLLWPYPGVGRPIEKFSEVLIWFSIKGTVFVFGNLILALIGLMALIVWALRKRDSFLGWILGLIPVFIVVLFFMIFAVTEANVLPGDGFVLIGWAAFLLVPFALLVCVMAFLWSKEIYPGLAMLSVAVFILIGFIPLASFLSGSLNALNHGNGGLSTVQIFGMLDLERVIPGIQSLGQEILEEEANIEPDNVVDDVVKSGEARTPHLQQFSLETMLWMPDLITDDNGNKEINFVVSDNLNSWRIMALASTQDGRLGSTTAPLRVFQDFFVDLDLPMSLTIGDEVSVPVGVYNHMEETQIVNIEVEMAGWFELLQKPSLEVEIAGKDIAVVYFRIRAKQIGMKEFQVKARGSQMLGAIQKEVRVYPDGKEITFSNSDRLLIPISGGPGEIKEIIKIPEDAIPGTQGLKVKIYPGVFSQVVEGLDSILRMPYGNFEQTSSVTYPNALVLDYLKFTGQSAPELQFKAEEFINIGYQRLTTYEVGSGGGFSLYGDDPPDRMLTAYGLQELSDMNRVWDVDQCLIQRAADWLFLAQDVDGSWENDRGLVHEGTWSDLGDQRLPVTAYIVWSLAEAGFGNDSRTQAGLAYVKENGLLSEDPYIIALIANAMVASDIHTGTEISDTTLAILDRLAEMSIINGNSAGWRSEVATFMGSEGQTGSIETTALVAFAFLRANRYPELANAALTTLIQEKDSFGTWFSTQATIMSLKAFLQSIQAGFESVDAIVKVRLNDGQIRTVKVSPENFDVVQIIALDDVSIGSDNVINISVEGSGNLMYQVTGSYYLPWDSLPRYPQLMGGSHLIDINLTYDRTDLTVNDLIKVNAIINLKEGKVESALIKLGVPPGFSIEIDDLVALVTRYDDVPDDYSFPIIERFELTTRQILIYVSNLRAEVPLEFEYHLRAKYPLVAQSPASNAYDYYNPDVNGETQPLTLVVNP